MIDPFSDYADTAIPRPVKRRMQVTSAKAAKRAERNHTSIEQQLSLEERGKLFRDYQRAQREQRDRIYDSEYGLLLKGLIQEFKRFEPADAPKMVDLVAKASWLRNHLDKEFRQVALRLINEQIMRIRSDAGLHEIDDPLPGAPDNAFRVIKRLLNI